MPQSSYFAFFIVIHILSCNISTKYVHPYLDFKNELNLTDIQQFHKAYQNKNRDCYLNINSDFSTVTSPLFLTQDGKNFVRASDSNGNIQIADGQKILISCPGRGNTLKNYNKNEASISCDGGKSFRFPDGSRLNSIQIQCRYWPGSILKESGTCFSGNILYQVGFEVSSGFIQLYEFCHDSRTSNTLYTKFLLTKDSANGQRYVSRPSWSTGSLYNDVNVDTLYKRNVQKQTFATILGSSELADEYIHEKDDFFLSRGHMVAKADFFYGSQQMATFYYGNAAPQWQTFNGNNWNDIEIAVRDFAGQYRQDLNVYTGVFGNDELLDVNQNKAKLSLDDRGKIPVPMMYWKIVHDPRRNLGITLVGLNSPYLKPHDINRNIICNDVCHKVQWLSSVSPSQRKNVTKGYLYCCDVNEFRRIVKYVPNIKVNNILG